MSVEVTVEGAIDAQIESITTQLRSPYRIHEYERFWKELKELTTISLTAAITDDQLEGLEEITQEMIRCKSRAGRFSGRMKNNWYEILVKLLNPSSSEIKDTEE